MIKEEMRFAPSNIMEGMTSISALLAAKAAGVNDRVILEIRFDQAKKEKNNLFDLSSIGYKIFLFILYKNCSIYWIRTSVFCLRNKYPVIAIVYKK